MNDKSKIAGALVLGAIAGAAIIKLLETNKGKELVGSVKEKTQTTADDIKTKINQLQNELSELVGIKKDGDSSKRA